MTMFKADELVNNNVYSSDGVVRLSSQWIQIFTRVDYILKNCESLLDQNILKIRCSVIEHSNSIFSEFVWNREKNPGLDPMYMKKFGESIKNVLHYLDGIPKSASKLRDYIVKNRGIESSVAVLYDKKNQHVFKEYENQFEMLANVRLKLLEVDKKILDFINISKLAVADTSKMELVLERVNWFELNIEKLLLSESRFKVITLFLQYLELIETRIDEVKQF